jgi:glyceraldehyde 3-phosphate dehydrogenase
MTPVGLNGFGRIGKCIFLQLIHHDKMQINAINAPNFDILKLEKYLKHDSVHHYNKEFQIEIVDNDSFLLNGRKIHILRDYCAENLPWRKYGIDLVMDASGCYLTTEKAKLHNVDKIIMSAPPTDDTPLFVYGANHEQYKGEQIISNASCTTNCIAPVLHHLHDHYTITSANFTTIHASTASQKVVDTAGSNSRTDRSIFNNIIPHSTGASASIIRIIPELTDKIAGTSVRIPINNVSLVDLNVELDTDTSLQDILITMKANPYLQVCDNRLVSSDYTSTTCPSIIDQYASMHLGGNQYKILIWYDNEWSYTHQLLQMAMEMQKYQLCDKFHIENMDFRRKNVILRLDLNLPMHDGKITSAFRLQSAIPTIRKILDGGASRLVIMSHLGRPIHKDITYSLFTMVPILEAYLDETIGFLSNGLSYATIDELDDNAHRIYLLENLRFHEEETNYNDKGFDNEAVHCIQHLGKIYVNDAFGCLHRDHLSICGIRSGTKGYGYLVEKELTKLDFIIKNTDSHKILAIIGGGKMDDKMELLKNLCKKVDTIYICGGNINSLIKKDMDDYLKEISSHKSNIVLMEDGMCARTLADPSFENSTENLKADEYFFDIGTKSLQTLESLFKEHDVIFWNGTLGVVEDSKYKAGSELCVQYLKSSMKTDSDKKVIVCGGDTGGFVNKYEHNFTHISTGGGASIEYITFNGLVGLNQFRT